MKKNMALANELREQLTVQIGMTGHRVGDPNGPCPSALIQKHINIDDEDLGSISDLGKEGYRSIISFGTIWTNGNNSPWTRDTLATAFYGLAAYGQSFVYRRRIALEKWDALKAALIISEDSEKTKLSWALGELSAKTTERDTLTDDLEAKTQELKRETKRLDDKTTKCDRLVDKVEGLRLGHARDSETIDAYATTVRDLRMEGKRLEDLLTEKQGEIEEHNVRHETQGQQLKKELDAHVVTRESLASKTTDLTVMAKKLTDTEIAHNKNVLGIKIDSLKSHIKIYKGANDKGDVISTYHRWLELVERYSLGGTVDAAELFSNVNEPVIGLLDYMHSVGESDNAINFYRNRVETADENFIPDTVKVVAFTIINGYIRMAQDIEWRGTEMMSNTPNTYKMALALTEFNRALLITGDGNNAAWGKMDCLDKLGRTLEAITFFTKLPESKRLGRPDDRERFGYEVLKTLKQEYDSKLLSKIAPGLGAALNASISLDRAQAYLGVSTRRKEPSETARRVSVFTQAEFLQDQRFGNSVTAEITDDQKGGGGGAPSTN